MTRLFVHLVGLNDGDLWTRDQEVTSPVAAARELLRVGFHARDRKYGLNDYRRSVRDVRDGVIQAFVFDVTPDGDPLGEV